MWAVRVTSGKDVLQMNRYRHEYKYMIDSTEEAILLVKAAGVLQRDPYADEDGTYVIRSLYFDDYADSCYYENENGTDPRSKFRIRYYNAANDRLRLEKKIKKRGMTLKESCDITVDECRTFMAGDIPDITDDMPDGKKELFTQMRLRRMIPKVIVTYERVPFIYAAGNVRITFDRVITSSVDIGHFLEHDYEERPVLPAGVNILEVKWDEILPRHIKDVMKMDSLQWTSFSKYYTCRKYHL